MDDPALVGEIQGAGDDFGDLERVDDGEPPLTAQPVAERFALDVRHDIVELGGDLAGIVEAPLIFAFRLPASANSLMIAANSAGRMMLTRFPRPTQRDSLM